MLIRVNISLAGLPQLPLHLRPDNCLQYLPPPFFVRCSWRYSLFLDLVCSTFFFKWKTNGAEMADHNEFVIIGLLWKAITYCIFDFDPFFRQKF